MRNHISYHWEHKHLIHSEIKLFTNLYMKLVMLTDVLTCMPCWYAIVA